MPEPTLQLVLDTVGGFYEAAYDGVSWPSAMNGLRDLFGGSGACIARMGPDLEEGDSISSDADPAFRRSYLEEFGAGHELARAVAAVASGLIYRLQNLIEPERLQRDRFVNEWMRPQNMHDGLGFKLGDAGSSFWFFDVQRGRNQPGMGLADIELMARIAPHMARAARISRDLRISRMISGPPGLSAGIVVLNRRMRLVAANAAADAMLSLPGSPLDLRSGTMRARDAAVAGQLARLVAGACAPRGRVLPGLGGDILIRGATVKGMTRRDLSVSIGPLAEPHGPRVMGEPCAALFVREVTLGLPDNFTANVRRVYELTPKEAELAAGLAAGRSLATIAAEDGIARSTLRSRLEVVFLKTGTHRQAELVALLKSAHLLSGH